MSQMSNALKAYFEKLNAYFSDVYGTKPTVCYTNELNRQLLVSAPNEDGDVEWEPLLQKSPIDFSLVESKLKFKINDELRAYYSTYLFLGMNGKLGSTHLYFQPLDDSEKIPNLILRQYSDGQVVFPKTQIFLIGTAVVNDDDSFFIYYDNASRKTFCFETDTKKEILLSYSLARTIGEMEAFD